MRYSCVLLLLCLSWTSSQDLGEEERKRLAELFGTQPTATEAGTDLTPDKKPTNRGGEISQAERDRLLALYGQPNSTTSTSISTSTTTSTGLPPDSAECETTDGKIGVCVLHYQCNPDGKVNTDGTDLLDMRLRVCPHYLQVCCLEDDVGAKPPPPVVATQDCGWTNPGAQSFRITNYEDGTAEFGDFPWMVAVLRRSDGITWSQNDYLGGGSIIHPSVVLTAAHKVDGKLASELKCRGGEWDTQTESEVYPHQERNVKKIIQHADYYKPSVYNSIALLVLEAPFELASAPHMGVACVLAQPPPAGARCYSMGWGKEFAEKEKYAVVLKKVQLPTVARDRCQKELRKTRLGVHFVLHPSLTCAGGEPGKDTCRGDGGSPLVCPIGDVDPKKEASRFGIAGLVAWGIGCGDAVPGAYVNVPLFADWLRQRMREEGYDTSSYTAK